jgi:hypothetical protein
MRYVVAVLLVLLVAGVAWHFWPEIGYYRAAARFDAADAAGDASRAWENGDRRLMGAYGIGLFAPGVPEDVGWFYERKFGVNGIRGTSDCLTSGGDARFNAAARDYAGRYNQEILRRIQGTPSLPAESFRKAVAAVGGKSAIVSGNIAAVRLPLRPLKDPALKEAVLALKAVEFFQIYGDPFTQDEHLLLASDIKGLTSLILADTAVTNAGLDHVRVHEELDTLFLSRTVIDDSGLEKLGNLRNLKVLYLTGSKVTDRGLTHLEHFEKLESIYLPEEGVTDAGMVHLSRLKALKELVLSPAVTDQGLAQLRGLKSLKIVSIRSAKVTDQGVRDFEAAIPGVHIYR